MTVFRIDSSASSYFRYLVGNHLKTIESYSFTNLFFLREVYQYSNQFTCIYSTLLIYKVLQIPYEKRNGTYQSRIAEHAKIIEKIVRSNKHLLTFYNIHDV